MRRSGPRRREGAGALVSPPPPRPPNSETRWELGGPRRPPFPAHAPAVPWERPSPGLGLAEQPGARGPALTSGGPRLARPGVLPGSRPAKGGNGLGSRKSCSFESCPRNKTNEVDRPIFSPS
uniref:Uncharacterized protein n=1 Tax=Pipistrellus kuhlii TaxID=59472 RepID=A0A7J7TNG5_PIPKU|nr:hypothetical protein mPipKuh1_009325 [Pipistrellus kuhlii]